jgi:hypothetical protein
LQAVAVLVLILRVAAVVAVIEQPQDYLLAQDHQ